MTGTTVERKYVLTRLAAGDYLLPSNDGETLWRIARGVEIVGGRATDTPGPEREVHIWQLWRFHGRWKDGEAPRDDLEDWSEWDLWDSWLDSRHAAIEAALRAA